MSYKNVEINNLAFLVLALITYHDINMPDGDQSYYILGIIARLRLLGLFLYTSFY